MWLSLFVFELFVFAHNKFIFINIRKWFARLRVLFEGKQMSCKQNIVFFRYEQHVFSYGTHVFCTLIFVSKVVPTLTNLYKKHANNIYVRKRPIQIARTNF